MSYAERFLDDLGSKSVDLEVHLNGSDSLVSSGDLEVHVAVEVLKSLNVDHRHPAVSLGDKSAGNSRNGRLNRHARIHKSEGRAADRCLRGGAV